MNPTLLVINADSTSLPLSTDVNCGVSVILINPSIDSLKTGTVLTELCSVLINVWFDCGKCLIAPLDEDTNVCNDWGKCFTALSEDDTNVCIEPDALPALPTLIVNVPSCLSNPLVVADTNVWEPTYGDEPMFISNVFVVTFEISNHLPLG